MAQCCVCAACCLEHACQAVTCPQGGWPACHRRSRCATLWLLDDLLCLISCMHALTRLCVLCQCLAHDIRLLHHMRNVTGAATLPHLQIHRLWLGQRVDKFLVCRCMRSSCRFGASLAVQAMLSADASGVADISQTLWGHRSMLRSASSLCVLWPPARSAPIFAHHMCQLHHHALCRRPGLVRLHVCRSRLG